jgi:hypothetical protein
LWYLNASQKSLHAKDISYIKQYSNQSGLMEYNYGVRLPIPTATQGFHPFITERCYRALLYPPSLPSAPFADCIWMYLYRLQINWEI